MPRRKNNQNQQDSEIQNQPSEDQSWGRGSWRDWESDATSDEGSASMRGGRGREERQNDSDSGHGNGHGHGQGHGNGHAHENGHTTGHGNGQGQGHGHGHGHGHGQGNGQGHAHGHGNGHGHGAGCDGGAVANSAPTSVNLNGVTYTATMLEEFDSFSAFTGHGSGGIWATSFSPHEDDTRYISANGEGQYYVDPDMVDLPNPFSIDNGIMTITAQELTAAQQAAADGQEYSAGMMSTELSFAAETGYVEISAKIPDQQGFLSSFWLLPADGDWSAEIDVFEILGHTPDHHHTNVWEDGTSNQQTILGPDLSDGFHTYGLEWTADSVTWYLDGEAIRTVNQVIDEEMYLVLSLAVDTTWTGDVDATTDFSDGFQIDYIRVYEDQAQVQSNTPVVQGQIIAEPTEYGNTAAAETLYGTRWDDVINGGGADDTLYGRDGEDVLSGDDGDDDLFGQNGDDVLEGGDGGDRLIGGAGDDRLEGGGGTDHYWGGVWAADGAADTFVFNTGDGKDYIHDFENGTDFIDLVQMGTDWSAVSTTVIDQGWATLLDLQQITGNAGDQMFVVGVAASDIGADDFIFNVA